MHSDRTKDALDGIPLNIEAIVEFTADLTLEQFSADRRTFYAVTRALEIISEASRRLPDDLMARYPGTRWSAIRGAGNIYRHTYSKVSAAQVWDTAVRQLDDLKLIVDLELKALETPKPTHSREDRIDEGSEE